MAHDFRLGAMRDEPFQTGQRPVREKGLVRSVGLRSELFVSVQEFLERGSRGVHGLWRTDVRHLGVLQTLLERGRKMFRTRSRCAAEKSNHWHR
jgi:hypothetical protein